MSKALASGAGENDTRTSLVRPKDGSPGILLSAGGRHAASASHSESWPNYDGEIRADV